MHRLFSHLLSLAEIMETPHNNYTEDTGASHQRMQYGKWSEPYRAVQTSPLSNLDYSSAATGPNMMNPMSLFSSNMTLLALPITISSRITSPLLSIDQDKSTGLDPESPSHPSHPYLPTASSLSSQVLEPHMETSLEDYVTDSL